MVSDYSYGRQPPFLSLSEQQKGSKAVDWELEVVKLYDDRKKCGRNGDLHCRNYY